MRTKEIAAVTKWLRAEEGGRKTALDIGVKYFPTITLDEDRIHAHCSVSFTIIPINLDGSSKISFFLLIDNDAIHCTGELLAVGTKSCFCEGSKVVAKGIVTE